MFLKIPDNNSMLKFEVEVSVQFLAIAPQNEMTTFWCSCVVEGATISQASQRAEDLVRTHFRSFAKSVSSFMVTTNAIAQTSQKRRVTRIGDLGAWSYDPSPKIERSKAPVAPLPFDALEIENLVVSLSVQSLREFAAENQFLGICAFGFDCHAIYGEILLCINTEDVRRKLEAGQFSGSRTPGQNSLLSLSFGDWKHQGFNATQSSWNEGWASVREGIEMFFSEDSDDLHEESLERIMLIFTRALIRVERSGALELFNRTDDFFIHIADHDETHDRGAERLELAREALMPN